jgi:hypothetical protein
MGPSLRHGVLGVVQRGLWWYSTISLASYRIAFFILPGEAYCVPSCEETAAVVDTLHFVVCVAHIFCF